MKSSLNIVGLSAHFLALAALCLVAEQSARAQIFDINTPGDNVYAYPLAGGAGVQFIGVNGYASGLAYSNGELFVAQNGDTPRGSDISEYNASTGVQNTTFVGSGYITAGLNNPEGMSIDGNDLFVANRTNSTAAVGSITEYDITTGAATTLIGNLFQPTDVLAYNGNLYVTLNNGGGSGTAGTVEEFSEATGAQVAGFSITGLAEPQGITVDNGNLFVTNEGLNTIGEYSATTGAAIRAPFAGPTNPYGITTLPNGDIVVTSDSPGSHVSEYDGNGNLLSSNFLPGSNYELAIVASPEPSTMVLSMAGLGVVVLLFRRVQRA